VFVGHGALSDALIARCHREGARVYAEFGVFQGKKVAEARPELWPIGADGKRLAPEEWYLGLCPNQPAYREEKLAELGELARKCARIAAFTREARRVLKAARPQAVLGIFAVPWRDEEHGGAVRAVVGQDFRLLARDVDVFSPMTYHRMVGRPVAWAGEVASGLR